MFKRIDHVAFYVSNIEVSMAFYTNYFGFKAYYEHYTPEGDQVVSMKLGNTILELVSNGTRQIKDMHIALQADNFDEAMAFLAQHPVLACRQTHPIAAREAHEAGWRRATFVGPDNELIEIRG